VNPPCVFDRGDISCSNNVKFDDDDDDDDDGGDGNGDDDDDVDVDSIIPLGGSILALCIKLFFLSH